MTGTSTHGWSESPWLRRSQHILSLLRAIDRSTVKGCPDYAMLLLIATYGLRRSEVSCLEIDDIQWRARMKDWKPSVEK